MVAKSNFTLSYYLVAYIDMLGQQSRLEKFRGLTPSGDCTDQLTEAVKDSLSIVSYLRETIKSYYESVSKIDAQGPHQLSGDQLATALSLVTCNINVQAVSDTILLSVCFNPEINKLPILGVRALLLGCAATFIDLLVRGHALRGGIELGMAADIGDGGIYGPALMEASYLEKKVAQYPRIVIGNELQKYLAEMQQVSFSEFCPRYDKGVAEFLARTTRDYSTVCSKLVVKDDDGIAMLDYLGPGLKEITGQSLPQVGMAKQFLIDERERFRRQQNEKLSSRYERAINYFNSRLGLWQ